MSTMVVQHNLRAMNANRMLGITTGQQAKSSEKLSSGYKINRAADDAAGLAISEKMRKQIRGLTQASLNAQDGISAVQTAEGALTEVQDMLQRMNELAVKAANGTMSEDDRQAIQNEVDQLVTEIDRVSETTKFNETYLLKGAAAEAADDTTESSGPEKLTPVFVGGEADPTVEYVSGEDGTTGTGLYAAGSDTELTAEDLKDYLEVVDGEIQFKEGTVLYTTAADDSTEFGTQGTNEAVTSLDDAGAATAKALYEVGGGTIYTDAACTEAVTADTDLSAYFDDYGHYLGGLGAKDTNGDEQEIGAEFFDQFADLFEFKPAEDGGDAAGGAASVLEFNLHVGAESAMTNVISVNIQSMSAASIGIDGLSGEGIMSEDNARAAIDTIGKALNQVSAQRAELGAIQNRLEHTIKNLDNVVENTTAAESQIRDTDMANEMVKFSNNQILAQAGQAMLAQSNTANQGVLSLLQ